MDHDGPAQNDVLVSLGCDYVTATAKDRDAAVSLHALGTSLFRVQRDFGNESHAWGMAGFSGYRCGSVQVGTRDEEVCVRLSSDSAARSWVSLISAAENISRLDLQATVQVASDVHRLIDRHKRAARRDSVNSGNRKRVRWVQEHHGGYTLYCGNRQSNVFGRIYDKHAESPMVQFEKCVRYEVQYQSKLALFVGRELAGVSSPRPRIASYVTQFFAGRGVCLELPYNDGATYCCSRPRSDAAKNLAWLSKSVEPCVRRLIDAGYGEEVMTALGLIQETKTDLDQLVHTET